jgi:hypothetical protein
MHSRFSRLRLSAPLAPLILLSGCARAPMVDIGGSFFPSWMVCLAFSIALAVSLRAFLRHRSLETEISTLALFYPGLVILLACVLWLCLFR